MKQQLRFIAALSAIALTTLAVQAQVEVLPFKTWAPNKNGNSYTSTKSSDSITATSGKTVYAETGTFNGHDIGKRIYFEDGMKLTATQGLNVSGKRKTLSIQGLQAGDIVKVSHTAANTGADKTAVAYINSKNVSYVSNDSTVNMTDFKESSDYYLQSDMSYTLASGNSLDILCGTGTSFRIQAITIVRPQISLGSTGYATYSNLTSTDFTLPDGLAAYTVSHGDEASAEVTLTSTNGIIPAGAGVVLKGSPNTTYTFSQSATSTTVDNNLMQAVAEDTKVTGTTEITTDGVKTKYNNYLLGSVDGKLGFYKSSGVKNSTDNKYLAAGKSYLRLAQSLVSSSSAKLNIAFYDNTVTAINGIGNANHKAQASKLNSQSEYNLAGQRVGKGYHGIVIVNGKKIIRK